VAAVMLAMAAPVALAATAAQSLVVLLAAASKWWTDLLLEVCGLGLKEGCWLSGHRATCCLLAGGCS
jgi:uncharacterized protein (DUF2141 family)